MYLQVLASGSSGNSMVVGSGDTMILVDIGLSYKRTLEALELSGLDPWQVRAVLLSHHHGDHLAGLRPWLNKHGTEVYATQATFDGPIRSAEDPGRDPRHPCLQFLCDQKSYLCRPIRFGEPFQIGCLRITPCPIVHDTAGAATFAIEDGRRKLMMIIETGRITSEMRELAADAEVIIIEANHDPDMVAESVNEYNSLKQDGLCTTGTVPKSAAERIVSTHLRNSDAAQFLAHAPLRASMAILVHLSGDRNTPEAARKAVEDALAESGREMDILVSGREPTPLIDLMRLPCALCDGFGLVAPAPGESAPCPRGCAPAAGAAPEAGQAPAEPAPAGVRSWEF